MAENNNKPQVRVASIEVELFTFHYVSILIANVKNDAEH